MLDDDLEAIPGVGSKVASKLKTAGYPTIESVAVTPPREIMEKTSIGFNTILKIQQAAREMFSSSFKTAQEVYEKRKLMQKCTTGSSKLDKILGGGIETQALTEFIGEYGTGKTQICLMLSVTAQLPYEKGGLQGNIAFIDTEGTFMPERVYQIASEMGLDPSEVANKILVARAYNSSHQCLLIDRLFTLCPENDIKLVVVDSMISHFRGEYVGRENRSIDTKLPDLEAVCGDESEIYEALQDTMFLTPWRLTETMEEAAEKGSYMTAGGLALHKGDVEKVKEYFRLTGRKLKILEIPERAVEKAQEYYAKCPKLE